MKNAYIKAIIIKMTFILNVINKALPKNNNRIVLYSNIGFRDNVEAVYRYLINKDYNKKYEIVCSTNEWKKYRISEHSFNVKFVNCYLGVFYYLTSKYFFYSFGKYPINPSKKQCVVNLWHGMPLKKIGALVDSEKNNNQNYFTYILSTSEFFKYYMQQAFQCIKEQIIICGQPRNDDLFNTSVSLKSIFKLPYNSKIICYMPTFRKSNALHTNNNTLNNCLYEELKSSKNLKILNSCLKIINVFFFIKPHPMDEYDKKFIKYLSNIVYVDDYILKYKNLNTYQFLGNTDALITDYSSVYFDYLLLDKPLGFIIDDIQSYSNVRGFIVKNPESIMPGKKIHNQDEFFDFCKEIANDVDDYKQERKRVNDLVNYYKDGNNCERLLKMVGIE